MASVANDDPSRLRLDDHSEIIEIQCDKLNKELAGSVRRIDL